MSAGDYPQKPRYYVNECGGTYYILDRAYAHQMVDRYETNGHTRIAARMKAWLAMHVLNGKDALEDVAA